MLNRSVTTDSELHRVVELLRLAALGIDERPDIVLPRCRRSRPRAASYACAACQSDVSHSALDR